MLPLPVAAESDATQQQQNNQHEQNQAEPAAWPVTPSGTVRPGRKSADEEEDEDNEQNERNGHRVFPFVI